MASSCDKEWFSDLSFSYFCKYPIGFLEQVLQCVSICERDISMLQYLHGYLSCIHSERRCAAREDKSPFHSHSEFIQLIWLDSMLFTFPDIILYRKFGFLYVFLYQIYIRVLQKQTLFINLKQIRQQQHIFVLCYMKRINTDIRQQDKVYIHHQYKKMQSTKVAQELDKILLDLKSKNPAVQSASAKALQTLMENHRELSDEVFFRLLEPTRSTEKHELLGVFQAINRIVKAIGETKTLPFVQRYLPLVFQQLSSSDLEIIIKAAQCVGSLTKLGGPHNTEVVETHVKASISWLRTGEGAEIFGGKGAENRRFAALLVLREFCMYAPVVTFTYITSSRGDCLKDILNSIKDPKVQIRDAAFGLIQAFLKLIANREEGTKKELYLQIYHKAKADFTSGDALSLHASLMIIEALLTYSKADLQMDHYIEICDNVMRHKEHKNVAIKKALVSLIPKLAGFSVHIFVQKYLKDALGFIIEFITKKAVKERGAGFVALGQLCKILPKEKMQPNMKMIYKLILDEVINGKRQFCPEVLDCVEMAMGNYGMEFITSIPIDTFLDSMFYIGLNEKLISALKQIMAIPGTDKNFIISIQIRLLNAISVLLTQKSFNFSAYLMKLKLNPRDSVPHIHSWNEMYHSVSAADGPRSEQKPPGYSRLTHKATEDVRKVSTGSFKDLIEEEKANTPPLPQTVFMDKESLKKCSQKVIEAVQASTAGSTLSDNARVQMIILALRTLSEFDFTEFSECLAQFVQEHVLNYLEDENAKIRKAAIKTGCSLYVKNSKTTHSGNIDRVNEIIERFLIVSITDSDYKIRTKMLKYLNKRFDTLLAHKTNLKLLFQCVQNSVFEVRQQAIMILGRIADHNPSVILPYLRNELVQLLSQLEYSANIKEKEEAAKLLSTLMKYSGRMCEPYTEAMLNCLIPKLRDSLYTSLVPSVLSAMGQLSEVGGEMMRPKLKEIIPLIIENLKDQSNVSKREIAVNALTHIVESTNYAIYPYVHYPHLITILRQLLLQETSLSLRNAVLRLMGSLGALDPYKMKQIQLYASMSEASDSDMYEGCYWLYEEMLGESRRAGHDHKGARRITASEVKSDREKENKEKIAAYLQNTSKTDNITQLNETFYPTVAIKALMRVLLIPNLKDHHEIVLQASKFILKSLTTDCVPFLPIIIPPLLNLIKTGESNMTSSLFEFLSELVNNVGDSIEEFCPLIFEVIYQFLDDKNPLIKVLELIETLSRCARSVFKNELSIILPKLLAIVHEHNVKAREQVNKALATLKEFGELLDEYLHLTLPVMISICSSRETDSTIFEFKIGALAVIKSVIKCPHFKDYLAMIVHPLVKLIEPTTYSEYGVRILGVLTQMMRTLSVEFAMYLPAIQHVVLKYRFANYDFSNSVSKFLHLNIVDVLLEESAHPGEAGGSSADHKAPISKQVKTREQKTDLGQLMKEFDASKCSIKEDWIEWLKKTSIELLRQSPSPVLYACSSLAQVYDPIASELFNMAFASCWKILNDRQKEYIISNLYRAIESITAPSVIHQTILNLAEFMEHEENSLPILTSSLSSLAEKCNALAKALYYREIEFESNPQNVIESLISINYGLQQPEAANGILIYAQKHLNIEMKEEWYQKLHRWEDALRSYQAKLMRSPKADDALIGQMQCQRALSDWEALGRTAEEVWTQPRGTEVRADSLGSGPEEVKLTGLSIGSANFSSPMPLSSSFTEGEPVGLDLQVLKPKIAEMSAAAAWNLGKWDDLEEYNRSIEPGSYENLFYDSVLCIHKNSYQEALNLVDRAREALDSKTTSLLNESYSRAYSLIIELQHLKELEEIITYKLSEPYPGKREKLESLWTVRQMHMQKDIDIWQKILTIRSLVKHKTDDVDLYIKYANLCRKNGRFAQCRRVLEDLRKDLDISRVNDIAKVDFAYLKCLYDHGNQREVYEQLKATLINDQPDIDNRLKARCYLKLGMWEKNQLTILADKMIDSVIYSFQTSTQLNPQYYKAWHAFGLMNYDALCMFEDMKKKSIKNPVRIKQHCIAAINGFVHAISLGGNDITKALQNLLRLIKLWFSYGDQPDQEKLIRESFEKIDVTAWLAVIPQILARIDIKNPVIRKMMFDLLDKIGRHEPQALLYPLCMLLRSSSPERRKCAEHLKNSMMEHSANIMTQALQVSNELIRSAILLTEQWYETIEEATRICYSTDNVHGAVNLLLELHDKMSQPPETMNEIAFHQAYGSSLKRAEAWLRKFVESKNEMDLNQAWEIYYTIYKSVYDKVPEMQSLELRNVAPKLLALKNLDIVVPGLYKPGGVKHISIAGFNPVLSVLPSKQHPRKLTMLGNDGREYLFLLKGHEDNRQDERAMQLFGLVNTLLSTDPHTQKKDLSIRRYVVIPLNANSGIIGWVPNCDTLHVLIKEYRTTYKIIQNIEFKLMKSMCENFELCCLVNKVEIFRHAMDHTFGQDLYKILWLKSKNSEVWLERRTNYTRSHAVMCMVGYILGLGDRHPSNLMLDRYSGKIVHIDFGDCFEAAMRREKFPEKVPFRLTRMLTKAMEVSGIEGNYRTTCEHTMRVLRDNKDSLLAILEAFVYDPLISFRLLAPTLPKQAKQQQQKVEAVPIARENPLERFKAGKNHEDEKKKIDYMEKDFMRMLGPEGDAAPADKLNQAAQFVMERIRNKLNGKEFNTTYPLDVQTQVDKLIKQATSDENLAQCYIGWCPYWQQ
eukprot:TRINITY_DN1420_c0_g2_i1.p1 TRINITY_DN1420_c0_g2~~TRINITY_DN1420_c0_g2_i1.p1  ORF type:complete len:2697 (-),score=257.94 TRINITY_DN1420_c0_g2_i1:82-8172(-)